MKPIHYDEIDGLVPSINLVFTHSIKKANKLMRKCGCGNMYVGHYEALSNQLINPETGHVIYIVYMQPNLDWSAAHDAGLLAHEATHIAQRYFEYMGEHSPSKEFEAYLVGNLTAILCDKHFEWKRKKMEQ